jgi:hypothetical protein
MMLGEYRNFFNRLLNGGLAPRHEIAANAAGKPAG